jgi:hypothetical protein
MGNVFIRRNSQETMEKEMTIQWVELEDLKKMQLKITDLYWEYDRMSSSGQKSLDELATLVGVPTERDIQKRLKQYHKDTA